MSDRLADLFTDTPEILHGDTVMITGVCHACGAETEPIPLTDTPDNSGKWTGVFWADVTLAAHKRDGCPGQPPDTPGVHLRPANPNYAP